MLLCPCVVKFIFPETADGLAGYLDYSWLGSIHTIPYGSSFLFLHNTTNIDPTIYQYNAAEEEFTTLPVNMSKPVNGAIPILVDLDMFPACAEDTA